MLYTDLFELRWYDDIIHFEIILKQLLVQAKQKNKLYDHTTTSTGISMVCVEGGK